MSFSLTTSSKLQQHFSQGIGLCLMLLLHLLGLWMVLAPEAPALLSPSAGDEVLTYIVPPGVAASSSLSIQTPKSDPASPTSAPIPAPLPPVQRPTRPKVPPRQRVQKPKTATLPQIKSSRAAPPIVRKPAITDSVNAVSAPEEDFSTRLEAARKRREAQSGNNAQSDNAAESASQRANRIARDNIAFQQQGQSTERDQSGGVFQLRSVRLHNAEFVFRGWNTDFRRNSLQVVEVEQGSEADIETAVIKRMIVLIRTQKPGKFMWKSIRAGRLVSLDAGPGYDDQLQQFLMREFFPDYLPGQAR